MRLRILFVFFVTCFFYLPNVAQSATEGKQGRPKIGLVLSGGGAKGFCHIGVLKVIEDLGIPIDFIGGTSAGALIGGFYAAGYTADQIEEMVLGLDWERLMNDGVNRDYVPFFDKEEIYRYNLSLPIYKRRIDLPNAFLGGQNIQHLFSDKTLRFHNLTDFSQLPIPFLCIAADLQRSEEVVLKSGYLPQAMRASMAVPAAISAVEVDGRMLVDGGVINNFPVDRVKEMGADIIIGVDLRVEMEEDSSVSVNGVVSQLIQFLGHDKYRENKKNTDIYINPSIKEYGGGDFNNEVAIALIKKGVEAGDSVRSELLALLDSIGPVNKTHHAYKKVADTERFYISDIKVSGVSDEHLDYVKGKLEFDKNQWVDFKLISEGIDKIYAGLNYESVNYRLTGGEKKTLTLYLKESNSQTLNLGVHYDGDNSASLLVNTTLRNITGPGSILSADLKLSQLTGARLRYTLDRGASPGLELNFDSRKLNFDYEDEDLLFGNVKGAISRLQMNMHSVFYHSFTVGLGLSMEFFDVDTRIYYQDESNPLLSVEDRSFFNYQAFLKLDTKDDIYFPTKGSSLMLNLKVITDDFYGLDDSNPVMVALLKYKHASSFSSRFSLIPGVYLRMIFGLDQLPPYYSTQIGGEDWVDYYDAQIPFYGLKLAELQTNNAMVARLETRYRIFSNQYVHGFMNVGLINSDLDVWNDYGTYIYGGGLGYSFNSVFGPATIKFLASNYRSSMFTDISLGFWF